MKPRTGMGRLTQTRFLLHRSLLAGAALKDWEAVDLALLRTMKESERPRNNRSWRKADIDLINRRNRAAETKARIQRLLVSRDRLARISHPFHVGAGIIGPTGQERARRDTPSRAEDPALRVEILVRNPGPFFMAKAVRLRTTPASVAATPVSVPNHVFILSAFRALSSIAAHPLSSISALGAIHDPPTQATLGSAR